MTFIIIFMGLMIERFFDWSHLRSWFWLTEYQQIIERKLPEYIAKTSPYLILAIAVIPFLGLIFLIQIAVHTLLYGLVNLLFSLVILLYCFGPRNLWADTFSCLNLLLHGQPQLAHDKIAVCFDQTNNIEASPYTNNADPSSVGLLHDKLLKNIFIASVQRIFSIVCWFVVLGPLGALLYRIIEVLVSDVRTQKSSELNLVAYKMQAILDYVPIRIFAAIFAIGGHFTNVVACWRQPQVWSINSNRSLLTECGKAALHTSEPDLNNGATIKSALGLIDRSLVVTLVLLAASVLIAF